MYKGLWYHSFIRRIPISSNINQIKKYMNCKSNPTEALPKPKKSIENLLKTENNRTNVSHGKNLSKRT